RNYEIYDKELLAIMTALSKWWHYLIDAEQEFEIWTNHQNILYFKEPRKLNRQWMTELSQYHFTIHHMPCNKHIKANLLSRQADYNRGEDDNRNIILLDKKLFIQTTQINQEEE
ncbi:hypothetical protein SERLA73DRAFT_15415, partial [Serpula lacrymans var. lacrymans S7.3]